MSLLPAGRSLTQALPDIDELLADPRAYLDAAPLAFGPRRMVRLALFFAIPGLLFLASCLVTDKADGERVALGVGLLLGAGVWAGWSLLMRGHEIVLHPDGVEVVSADGTVWAPWALFHVEGRPFVPTSDSPRAGLILPIDPAIVPHVVLLRGGVEIARGTSIRVRHWSFSAHDEVVLPGRYEVSAIDLGELLLVLGGRLGKDKPLDPAPHDAEVPTAPFTQDPAGWITLPLTRLRLPSCCARCAGPRDVVVPLPVTAWGDWLLGWLLGGIRTLEVPMPLCEPCRDFLALRQRRGGFVGSALGAFLGTSVGYAGAGWWQEGRDIALWLGGSIGLAVGVIAGSILGVVLTRRLPVRIRRYSPSRGLVSVRFENPEVAARVLATVNQRAGPRNGV
jgi:hypothetical protein